jgi:hypothetical protein
MEKYQTTEQIGMLNYLAILHSYGQLIQLYSIISAFYSSQTLSLLYSQSPDIASSFKEKEMPHLLSLLSGL